MNRFTSMLASLDRRSWVAIAVIVIGTVVAVTAGGYLLLEAGQPTTISFNLRNGQTEVPLDQKLVFHLSRPTPLDQVRSGLRISTGSTSAAVLPASAAATVPPSPGPAASAPPVTTAEGQLQGSGDRRTFTWVPSAPFLDLTQYTVRLAPQHDGQGHRVTGRQWRFTTTLVPRVLGVTTDTGATVAENSEVGVNTSLRVNFNTAMDQTTVKVLVNSQPATLTWDQAGRVAGLTLKGINVGPLDMTVGPGGRDAMGHSLPTVWDLKASVVFRPDIKTVPLVYPAIVQIPNDNYGARDQSGLSAADFVYEYETEGGITRLSAVFTRVPSAVGPIRSGRLISIKLTRHYAGKLFLSGMSQGTFARLQADPVPSAFEGDAAYFRSNNRPAPNNLYLNDSAIQKAETGPGSNDQVKKGPVGTFTGDPAATIAVPDHDSTYAYEVQTGTYIKTEAGRPMNDALIGQPVRIQMVVVMHTNITTTGIIEDANGVHGLDFDMESGGAADYYYQGKKASGRWSASSRSSGFVFTLDNGLPLNMPNGVVWVDVTGNTSGG